MNRCANCKKKIVISFMCTCHSHFCTSCRLPEIHKCQPEKQKIVLEKITKDKITKI